MVENRNYSRVATSRRKERQCSVESTLGRVYDSLSRGFLLLVASHGLQNPWSNESSGGIPWCDESRGVIFNNPLDAILNQQQNKSGNV